MTPEDENHSPPVARPIHNDQDGEPGFANGCAMTMVAVLFGVPAVWMHWMLRQFADGNTWYDFIVRLLLDELIGALGIFAVLMIVWGFFGPKWLEPIVEWSTRNMAKTVLFLFVLLFGSLLLFIFVYAILFSMGIKF